MKGGIIDDLIVYRLETNKVSFSSKCIKHSKRFKLDINNNNKFNCSISNLSDDITHSLQFKVLWQNHYCQNFTSENILLLKNYSFINGEFANCEDIIISKTGYTGSGGLEIYIPNVKALKIWDTLFSNKEYQI